MVEPILLIGGAIAGYALLKKKEPAPPMTELEEDAAVETTEPEDVEEAAPKKIGECVKISVETRTVPKPAVIVAYENARAEALKKISDQAREEIKKRMEQAKIEAAITAIKPPGMGLVPTEPMGQVQVCPPLCGGAPTIPAPPPAMPPMTDEVRDAYDVWNAQMNAARSEAKARKDALIAQYKADGWKIFNISPTAGIYYKVAMKKAYPGWGLTYACPPGEYPPEIQARGGALIEKNQCVMLYSMDRDTQQYLKDNGWSAHTTQFPIPGTKGFRTQHWLCPKGKMPIIPKAEPVKPVSGVAPLPGPGIDWSQIITKFPYEATIKQ